MWLVLHLGFSQRGTAMHAPVDWLLPLVNHALLDESPKCADDRGLVARGHRQVWLVPRAHDAKPFEIFAHDPDVFRGVRLAFASEIGD